MTDDPKLDRNGLEILDRDEALTLAATQPVGRLAFEHGGVVEILPVTFRMHEGDVVFRTAPGAKLGAGAAGSSVTFEVDAFDAEDQSGWSVVVHGVAEIVTDPDELHDLYDLDVTPWTGQLAETEWVRVRARQISGRRTPR